jgi:L-seryl-tRNA(Ser) seleniumtransferase
VVTFSGDKLLGGPQAGVLIGERELIRRMARDPMARALRLDKLSIAALEATLRSYLDPERALSELPTLRLLTRPAAELETAARRLAAAIEVADRRLGVEVVSTASRVGGGAQPDTSIPSWAVALTPPAEMGVEALARALREGDPPVVGRIEAERLLLDVRTLLPGDEERIPGALGAQEEDAGGR